MSKKITILAIESSCDDTSAAVIQDGTELSNVVADQQVHAEFGGVVPELASRAHQKNIVPVVDAALKQAGISHKDLDAVGYTRGPGLLGSLMVGASFAAGYSAALNIPVIEVNHMQAHILAHFIKQSDEPVKQVPQFPFLCLTVSGGHTQMVRVDDYFDMTVLGETRDDAAGEAFDKVAKLLQLPYPGGPHIDKLAARGNPSAFDFPASDMPGYDFSFSGLKTSVLYKLQAEQKENPHFIQNRKSDLAASVQHAIIKALMRKLKKAMKETGIQQIALAGGVSANSALRIAVEDLARKQNADSFIPPFAYCTDNAAMIGITAYYKFINGNYDGVYKPPTPNFRLKTASGGLGNKE